MQVVIAQYEGVESTPALPLAAGVLVATARRDPALAAAIAFAIEVERRPLAAAAAAIGEADVLGLSLYPWNVAYALAVAAEVRRRRPATWILAGGPSVPRRADAAAALLAAHPALDVLVLGEGELAFAELLRRRLRGAPIDDLGGLAVRAGDGARVTAPPRRLDDLAATGSPYLDGTFDALLAAHGRGRYAMALVETNRGCPFTCTFCDWSLTRKVAEFPVERVRAELAWIADAGFGQVVITDANFGIRPRDAALVDALVEQRRRTGSPSFVYFYLTKNDHQRNLQTIETLHAAGIACCVGLAVQDYDDDVLVGVRRDNIQSGEALALREICARRGLASHEELILGLPGQTYASFTRTLARAMPPYPEHRVVLFLCRLLENTELASPESRRRLGLVTRRCRWRTDRPGWDAVVDERQEIVVGSDALPVEAWVRTYRFAAVALAAYNHGLLRPVLRRAPALGLEVRDYLASLCEAIDAAPDGGALAAVRAALDRYVASILDDGPFSLPLPGDDGGAAGYEAADAVAAAALADAPRFLDAVEAHLRALVVAHGRDDGTLDELTAYLRLVTPAPGDPAARAAALRHDWPAYLAGGGVDAPLVARPGVAWFEPPAHAALADPARFAAAHVACSRARVGAGAVRFVPDAPAALDPGAAADDAAAGASGAPAGDAAPARRRLPLAGAGA